MFIVALFLSLRSKAALWDDAVDFPNGCYVKYLHVEGWLGSSACGFLIYESAHALRGDKRR